MIFLEIKAEIPDNKLLEFSQVKLAFIHDFQTANGFISFMEKPGFGYQIQISWKDQQCLNAFMTSQQFHYFKGALMALSKSKQISVMAEEKLDHRIT